MVVERNLFRFLHVGIYSVVVERNLFRSLHWSIHLVFKVNGIHSVFLRRPRLLNFSIGHLFPVAKGL